MRSGILRVVTLVACGPLLFPPGFCVCKAGGWVSAAPAAEQKAPPARSKSGCCANRACRGDHVERTGDSQPLSTPAPRDDSHLPGCPASAGVDWFKWVEPVAPLVQALPPVAVITFLLLNVEPLTPPSIFTSTCWPSSPPLYLSHCSFVI